MGKKRVLNAKRGDAISFRPLQPMRVALEATAERKTRSLADQIEHMVKLGILVSEALHTDDPDIIKTQLNIKGPVHIQATNAVINGTGVHQESNSRGR